MEGMEEKLGAILGNPQMMQQIMSMAQTLGSSPPPPPQEKPSSPTIDPAMIQKLMPLMQGSGIDTNQRALLKALSPYLSRDRIDRLEKAMRAAKMAGMVSGFLGGGSHV